MDTRTAARQPSHQCRRQYRLPGDRPARRGAAAKGHMRQLGGPEVLGYPASQRLIWDGFVIQGLQKVVLQWHPDTRTVAFLNVLDLQHDRGLDDWLLVYRMTPRPFDTSPDSGLSWEAVKQRHWAMLNANAAIRARYFGDPFAL